MSRATILALMAIMLSLATPVMSAYDARICSNTGVKIGFINGVQTPRRDGVRVIDSLSRRYGNATPAGEELTYQLLYNQTDKGLADFVETFQQRLAEHDEVLRDRMELFFGTVQGGDSAWARLGKSFPAAASLLSSILDDFLAKVAAPAAELLNKISEDPASPDTARILAEHRKFVSDWIFNEQKILFVAHSQGNLFLKLDYDYAIRSLSPVYGQGWVQAVHAGPASIALRGEYSLADKDLVINGLNLVGKAPPANDSIPGYLLRPAGENGEKDILGHGWFAIYFNKDLSTGVRIDQAIRSALISFDSKGRTNQCGLRRRIECNYGGWWSSPTDPRNVVCRGSAGRPISAPCRCDHEAWEWGGGLPGTHICIFGVCED